MAATHRGTCQVCGRIHRVNDKNGTIANHGYTVDWGWFNGTCRGSKNLPFEKSCELVKQSIEWSNDRIASLNAEIETTREWTVDSEIIVRVHIGYSRHNKSGYYNVKATIADDIFRFNRNNLGVRFTFNGEEHSNDYKGSGYPKTKEELLAIYIANRVAFIEKEITNVISYRTEQERRVNAWVETDLIEIKK